jgi:hypothetical protein
MKHATLLALLIAFVLALPTQADVPYTSDGGFSVVFPGDKKPQVESKPTSSGTLSHTATVDLGNSAFVTAYADIPVIETDAKTVLDGARDGALRSSEGKVLSEESVTIGGHPARRISMQSAKFGLKGDILLVLRDKRIITVMSFFTTPTYDAGTANGFLNSFKFP